VTGYLTAACYLGLILTGSRGGYASAVASLLVFTFLSVLVSRAGGTALFRKLGFGTIIAFVTVTAAVGWLIWQNHFLGERLRAMNAVDTGRLDLWRAAVDQWKLQPIVGTGSGTYLYYGRLFRAEGMQADPVLVHNDYLQLLSEYGIFGGLAFALFLGSHLRRGWQSFLRLGPQRVSSDGSILGNRFALTIGALCAIASYLVHSVVDFNMHIPPNAMIIAFVLGLIANPGPKTGIERTGGRVELLPRICMVAIAIILLLQSVRLMPGEYYAVQARSALRDEEPALAISFAEKALHYEQKNPNVFFYLGRALTAIGNQKNGNSPTTTDQTEYLAALNAFATGHRLAPLEESFPLDMAFVYDQLSRFQEAEWMFSIARSLDPRSANIEQLYQTHLQAWASGSTRVSSDKP
jgi:tetratricopeptide (TPR) repeat protein